MGVFDPNEIQNESIRAHYERALRRGESMAGTMADSFGTTRAPVKLRFIDEEAFNAYASFGDGAYLLELGKPVPLLLLMLFEKLLGEPRLFPWLDSKGKPVEEYEVGFIFDPADFTSRKAWKVSLTDIRSFAAGILADITVTFIQMHELGHVMCGHVEANHRITGRLRMAEIVETAAPRRSDLERERAWEADADSVAASFLVQYLVELIAQTQIDPAAALVFDKGEHTNEHVMSMAIVSLWAMFAYLRGARHHLGRHGSHPHPLVRMYYIKDMLITAARRELPMNLEILAEMIDLRLDEMLITLESSGLSKNHLFNDAYISRVERHVERLVASRSRHRTVCARWAWFDWE